MLEGSNVSGENALERVEQTDSEVFDWLEQDGDNRALFVKKNPEKATEIIFEFQKGFLSRMDRYSGGNKS